MRIAFKAPWHYLIWSSPLLSAEAEIGMTRLIRRKGLFYMVRLYWGYVTDDEETFTLSCASLWFAQNYPCIICAIGFFADSDVLIKVGLAWFITVFFGTVKYVGWLLSLLNRWPPLAKN